MKQLFLILAASLGCTVVAAQGHDKVYSDSIYDRYVLPTDIKEFSKLMTGKWGNDMPDTFYFSGDTSGFWIQKINGFKGKKKGWSNPDPFTLKQTNSKFYMIFTDYPLIMEIKSLDSNRMILYFPQSRFYRELIRRKNKKNN